MTLQNWFVFAMLAFAAAAIPGPAVLLSVHNSTRYGWGWSAFSALGNIFGLLFLGIVAVSGVGFVLTISQKVFLLMRYAGAAYLFYLGVRLLFQSAGEEAKEQNSREGENVSPLILFLQGVGVAISNPKAIVFLTALFPQFIHSASPLLPQFVALIATLMTLSFAALMIYAFLANVMKTRLLGDGASPWIRRACGVSFIGMSMVVAGGNVQK